MCKLFGHESSSSLVLDFKLDRADQETWLERARVSISNVGVGRMSIHCTPRQHDRASKFSVGRILACDAGFAFLFAVCTRFAGRFDTTAHAPPRARTKTCESVFLPLLFLVVITRPNRKGLM